MSTIKDYQELYLNCDVLLLANVSEKFRNNSLESYELCQSHCLSLSVLCWDAMLKMTQIKLELIKDPDMYIFYKKVQELKFFIFLIDTTKARNRYLKYYETKQESKLIMYLDANNLYCYAMSKFLPTSGFKWVDPQESKLNKYGINSSKECVLEVGLEHPKELRKLRNDNPLVPDKIEIKREILSENFSV